VSHWHAGLLLDVLSQASDDDVKDDYRGFLALIGVNGGELDLPDLPIFAGCALLQLLNDDPFLTGLVGQNDKVRRLDTPS